MNLIKSFSDAGTFRLRFQLFLQSNISSEILLNVDSRIRSSFLLKEF